MDPKLVLVRVILQTGAYDFAIKRPSQMITSMTLLHSEILRRSYHFDLRFACFLCDRGRSYVHRFAAVCDL
jgi:hypothetical protein